MAIVSALKGRSVPQGVAILGDMSVQGSILEPDAVGEMVLLARENGARTLFVPAAKREDVTGLPAGLLFGIEFHYFTAPAELATSLLDHEQMS